MNVCDTKVLHDTEFEANRAAAIAEHKYGEEMTAYQCGSHWHITHVRVDQRRGAGHFYRRCWYCRDIFKISEIAKHHCPAKEAKA